MANSNSSDNRDTLEFVAYLLWYFFLVFCCVFPTCCAYRRRRMMAQLQREEEALGQRRFHFVGDLGGLMGGTSEEEVRVERTKRIEEALKETTFAVKDKDITENTDGKTGDKKSTIHVDEELGAVLDHEVMDQSILQIPPGKPNGERTVPGGCAICLEPYKEGDSVAWSKEDTCKHAFHTECIIQWLAKKEDPKCPCCRQDFCSIEPVRASGETRTIIPFGLIPSNMMMRQAMSQRGTNIILVPTPDLVQSQVLHGRRIMTLSEVQASETSRTDQTASNDPAASGNDDTTSGRNTNSELEAEESGSSEDPPTQPTAQR
eukprot:scaffold1727_cov133-Cylindrotheca_fusiformis.AAC.39